MQALQPPSSGGVTWPHSKSTSVIHGVTPQHSFCQSKCQGQPKFKWWENQLYLLMEKLQAFGPLNLPHLEIWFCGLFFPLPFKSFQCKTM